MCFVTSVGSKNTRPLKQEPKAKKLKGKNTMKAKDNMVEGKDNNHG